MSQQQTVLKVFSNSLQNFGSLYPYEYLDTYSSIPIKINKSIAEIEDIATKNSSYSIGLLLPGSKKNNRFFENFFNVDAQSLYFNAIKRINCDVLIDSQPYFTGYMRLNKVSVMNSKIEYDVSLYSSIGDVFGQIGNNLLKDLNFDDTEYTFNHIFTQAEVTSKFYYSNFLLDQEHPYPYFYPIVHNGYNYDSAGVPNFSGNTSGSTLEDQTRLYTSTSPIGSWSSLTGATAAGAKEYYINSPSQGLRDNQLKPALNIYSLIKLMFKSYGYRIKSDLFNTPWFKTLYMYGYFSSELTKFSYKINSIQSLPLDGVDIIYSSVGNEVVVVKKGTGIPCYCSEDISGYILYSPDSPDFFNIPAGTGFAYMLYSGFVLYGFTNQGVEVRLGGLKYLPLPVGSVHTYVDNDYVDFSLVIDPNIKQIDILSSVAKKFNLVFIPDPENPNQIIIESYDYYIGTGQIYDWTPLLSWDQGFTVEPALNFIESYLNLTDLEDGDEGNRIFKNQTNRIYGENFVYNPTDFKSQEKKIETIFSSEIIRKWDDNINLPLGINYAASNETDSFGQVRWSYKGVKSKPKLFYWLGSNTPFISQVGQVFNEGAGYYNTYTVKIAASNYTGGTTYPYIQIPVISHTMPMGLADQYKINNDSLSILFNSELPVNIGIESFNTYTENDVYNNFYSTRVNNLYNANTRFLSGNFNLKYSDVQNLKWNDIIKINEQYFIINKISDYNLTNRELTKVELIQFNNSPQVYPDRYFSYFYCDNPSVCYKFKTNFTEPNLLDTNFLWSVYYDRQVGSLSGTTQFTSSFKVFNNIYVPYTMYEITQSDYNSATCSDWNCDTLHNYIYQASGTTSPTYSISTFWENSGSTKNGMNVWANCTNFYADASTYGIRTGSSVTYGVNICLPTPTPTPSPTATPTPTPTPSPTPIVPTPTGVPTTWALLAPQLGKLLTSNNYGNSFTEISSLPSGGWDGGVALSPTGQYQMSARVSGDLYLSNDYGSTWVLRSTPAPSYKRYGGVAVSSNGQYQFLSVGDNRSYLTFQGDYIYRSTDYGATFSVTSSPKKNWWRIATSSNGQYVAAITLNKSGISPDPNSLLYISSDYGVTYSSRLQTYFKDVSISNTGQYVSALGTNASTPFFNKVYVSNDYGSTFSTISFTGTTNPDSTGGIGISGDGRYQLSAINDGIVMLSNDYGVTWNNILSVSLLESWQTAKVSRNGANMLLGGGGDGVWVSHDYGVNWSNTFVSNVSVDYSALS
jgi:hypothetical protein